MSQENTLRGFCPVCIPYILYGLQKTKTKSEKFENFLKQMNISVPKRRQDDRLPTSCMSCDMSGSSLPSDNHIQYVHIAKC